MYFMMMDILAIWLDTQIDPFHWLSYLELIPPPKFN